MDGGVDKVGRCVVKDKNNPYAKNLDRIYWKNCKETTVYFDEDTVSVQLWSTTVFEYNFKTEVITLRTGGWFTPTTFRRINQAAEYFDLGFRASKESKCKTHDLICLHWIDGVYKDGEYFPIYNFISAGDYKPTDWDFFQKHGFFLENYTYGTAHRKGDHVLKFKLELKELPEIPGPDWRPTETIPEDYYAF